MIIDGKLYQYSKGLWYGKLCRPWQKLQPYCVYFFDDIGECGYAMLVSKRFQNVSLGLKGSHNKENKNE
jgi:hypothetical protein